MKQDLITLISNLTNAQKARLSSAYEADPLFPKDGTKGEKVNYIASEWVEHIKNRILVLERAKNINDFTNSQSQFEE